MCAHTCRISPWSVPEGSPSDALVSSIVWSTLEDPAQDASNAGTQAQGSTNITRLSHVVQACEETMRSSNADLWQMFSYRQSLRWLQRHQRANLQRRGTEPKQTCQLDGHFTFSSTRPPRPHERRCRDSVLLRTVRDRSSPGFHERCFSRHAPQSTSASLRVRSHGQLHRPPRNGQTGTEQLYRRSLGNSGRYTGSCASAGRRCAHHRAAIELVRSKCFEEKAPQLGC